MMKTVPISIINDFRDAYSRSKAILIPYRIGNESSDGSLYRFQDDAQDRLLKVMFLGARNYRKALLILGSRLKFVNFLRHEGVMVTEPLYSLNDKLYEILEDDNGVWVSYAMRRIHGKTMSPKIWDPEFTQNWGQIIGKLHLATQKYPDWKYCIDHLTSEKYLTWQSEWENIHYLCKDIEIKQAWERIGKRLRSLPINRDSFGFIHNDPHLWNLLVEDKKLTLIDFDVANHNWFINDIAVACQHVLSMLSGGFNQPMHHREHLVNFLNTFLKGYYLENDLSKSWLNHLDLFFAYRRILNYVLMEEWRKSKPHMQSIWKAMIINHPEILGRLELNL
jgi:Ser/Thr protein kinase RdoA (MazF antagonist)